MSKVPLSELRPRVDPASFSFQTTAEVEPHAGLIGQDRAWTYAELRDEVASAAHGLGAALTDGDPDRPVALLLDNGPAWVVADLALMRLRRPALPLPGYDSTTIHAGAAIRFALDSTLVQAA